MKQLSRTQMKGRPHAWKYIQAQRAIARWLSPDDGRFTKLVGMPFGDLMKMMREYGFIFDDGQWRLRRGLKTPNIEKL